MFRSGNTQFLHMSAQPMHIFLQHFSPSVHLSHAGIVPKWLHVSLNFFTVWQVHCSSFLPIKSNAIIDNGTGQRKIAILNEKSAQRRQTLRAGCSKAEPKIFTPLQTPFQEALGGQNLISWRWSLPLPTNPVW